MKRIQWISLVALLGTATFASASMRHLQGGALEDRTVLTVNSDGSCVVFTSSSNSRALMEQQVKAWARFVDDDDAETEQTGSAPATTETGEEPARMTDAELESRLRKTFEEWSERADEAGAALKIQVEPETVRVESTRTFSSVREMLEGGTGLLGVTGVAVENIRFENGTNGLLQLTLTPQAEAGRYLKHLRSQWKLSGTQLELRIVLPGRIVSSGFPEFQTNATWLALDGRKEETLDAAAKLYEEPTVILAESGGLSFEEPLDSKALQRAVVESSQPGASLPITDAGPGFLAEALTVTATTLHVFPEGEAYFKQSRYSSMQNTGVNVSARLFVPKGRSLLTVTDVRVLKAIDDKGRPVASLAEDGENGSVSHMSFGSDDDEETTSTQIELLLALPERDAQAIDELSAEAVAVTAGAWKQMTVTNLQENSTNEIDLSEVLPGAKMVLKKVSAKENQITVQADVTGPAGVQQLSLNLKWPGNEHFSGHAYDRSSRTTGDQARRSVEMQGYSFGSESSLSAETISLSVRHPEDLRRERVRFVLNALDLL